MEDRLREITRALAKRNYCNPYIWLLHSVVNTMVKHGCPFPYIDLDADTDFSPTCIFEDLYSRVEFNLMPGPSSLTVYDRNQLTFEKLIHVEFDLKSCDFIELSNIVKKHMNRSTVDSQDFANFKCKITYLYGVDHG